MATGGQDSTNDEISSDIVGGCLTLRSCDPCIKDNTSTDATQFCTECNEFLCDDCKRGHSRFKSGKHSFINATGVTDVPVVVDMNDMDKCEEHKKKIKFFCKDHSLLCCSTCAFIHRACTHVDELAKISDQTGSQLQALNDKFVKAGDKERIKIEDCKKTIKSLADKVGDLQKDIDTQKENIIKLFDDAKSRINNEANNILATESKRLEERQSSSENVLQSISDILPLCSNVINNGTPQQVFILARFIEKKLKDIEVHENEQRKKHFSMQLSLDFANETTALLRKGRDVLKLIDERLNNVTVSPAPSVVPTVITRWSLKPMATLYFTVAGMDFLPDKRLIVAYTGGKCIIMNDLLQKLGKPYCLIYKPTGVVCMSDTDVAVATDIKTIHTLSVSRDNVITCKWLVSTPSLYDYICLFNSTILIGFQNKVMKCAKISIIDGKEKPFSKVQFEKRISDTKINVYTCTYIHSCDKLIVCDRSNTRIYLYDAVKGTSTDVKLVQCIHGVSPGPGATVVVFCSRSIVHMTHEGQILSNNSVAYSNPGCVCVSKDFTRIAASNLSNSDIQLFETEITLLTPSPEIKDT